MRNTTSLLRECPPFHTWLFQIFVAVSINSVGSMYSVLRNSVVVTSTKRKASTRDLKILLDVLELQDAHYYSRLSCCFIATERTSRLFCSEYRVDTLSDHGMQSTSKVRMTKLQPKKIPTHRLRGISFGLKTML